MKTHRRIESAANPNDLEVVKRAGRIAAIQASLALAVVLLVVGAVVFLVDIRVQDRQISRQLESVAATADDANDPPPGMELALRDNKGRISTSDGGQPGIALLSGPTGLIDVKGDDKHLRALVMDRPEGRVVALLDLKPYQAGRNRLLLAIGFAELAGIVASVAVVVLFTRRSVRPLAQALSLQRRFVADASHELRAPLTVLHTRAQMLARRADTAGLAEVQEDAEALVADTRVLNDIVDDLLASATMEKGAMAGDRVDLSVVVQTVRDSMAPYAESLGVALTSHKDVDGSAGFMVIGSEAALRRALTALVDNALNHEHQGGTVELRVRRTGSVVGVSVSDDGIGIDPEAMATLFTRFSHGSDHTTQRRGKPYGIGLALVREIAQAHGGEIAVESTRDRGTTFTMTLPAAAGH